jgi:hypothetical protein
MHVREDRVHQRNVVTTEIHFQLRISLLKSVLNVLHPGRTVSPVSTLSVFYIRTKLSTEASSFAAFPSSNCMPPGFRLCVNDIFALLGCYAALIGV